MPPAFPAAAAAFLALALAGCNRTAQAPVPPPPPEGGCNTYLPQFRQILDNDAASGNLDRGAYTRATQDIAQAQTACAAGREAQARLIYLSARNTYGYPPPGTVRPAPL